MQDGNRPIALGIPDQVDGLATAPTDRGDEMQERLRYQWSIGVCLLAQGLVGIRDMRALWCEHHDDYLIELSSGQYVAVQVKTDSRENIRWRWSEEALVESIARFCVLEQKHGDAIASFEFQSNAAPYIPASSTESEQRQVSSPMRLVECCQRAADVSSIEAPYDKAFKALLAKTGSGDECLFNVLRKLEFLQGCWRRLKFDPPVRALPTQI